MERHEVLAMMTALKLAGMRAAYDDILADGLKRRHPVQQIIGTLLQVEIADKQARSIKYQMASARLPTAKELAEFDFAASPVNEPLIQELAGGGFLEGKRNIVLVGGTGTGKTHLAVAIARSCIRKGARGRCYNVVVSPIIEPQRKRTSASTAVLPRNTTCPPGRAASNARRKPASLPAASNTASAPRPRVSERTTSAASSWVASIAWVAPNRRAVSSFSGRTSTAMIGAARARRAPCTAFSPTPPQPITRALSPTATLATLRTPPTPVMTPQPIRQARSNGMSSGTTIAPDSGTMQYSACAHTIII